MSTDFSSSHGSVTQWIAALDFSNPDDAQTQLWNRYFKRLIGLARRKLGESPRQLADEEDVAVTALAAFFEGKQKGKFPNLQDREDLWPLLAKITACKAVDLQRRALAQKRGSGEVYGDHAHSISGAPGQGWLDTAIDDELSPEVLASMNEECSRLFKMLGDEELRTIARLRLEGWNNAEIAREIGVIERTVSRRVGVIRTIWGSMS